MSRSSLAPLLVLLLAGCTPDPPAGSDSPPQAALKIGLLGDSAAFESGAVLAVEQLNEETSSKLELVSGKLDGVTLAGLVDDPGVIGAITSGGALAVGKAAKALDASSFPVLELTDDLYDAGALRPSVFQMSTPASWQGFRLARYFGPGDRAYKGVALIRPDDAQGNVLSEEFSKALSLRKLRFVDSIVSTITDEQVASNLMKVRGLAPEVVVIGGPTRLAELVVKNLAAMDSQYRGRASIHKGWRPQVAGFEELLGIEVTLPAGTVASSDYALPVEQAESIDSVSSFLSAFRERYGDQPTRRDSLAYDAVKLLAGVALENSHEQRLEALKAVDRLRFSHLPITFGQHDQVAPERDVLGLWAVNESGEWNHLMRAFTSDLERTNILEDDWPRFFDGTVPGGEAPFFYDARSGITSRKSDDLH